MKKFFAAVCCTLLVASASFAQSGTRVETPVVQAVTDAAAAVTQAAPVEAAPMDAAPVEVVPMDAAPMTSGVVEGTVVNAPMAPMATSYPMAPIQQGCGCGGVVSAPMITSAPMVMGSPDMSQSVVSAPMAAAPVASDCGCAAAAPAPAATCCAPRERRQIIRGAFTQLRSRRSACCCN